jgi:predicted metal-dependent phosphoesterase TrpH
MGKIKADIHIHTCLSPCADIGISPKRIIEKAYSCGLTMIFITDHNTAENSEAVIRASAGYNGLKVYPGMEITSREEAHTLALFENMKDAGNMQSIVYNRLANTRNEQEYKEQIIANEFDEVEGFCKKSLFSSTDIRINEIVDLIHKNNGLAIASHIDRESFSIIGQLGFIPDDINFDALEVSPNTKLKDAKRKFADYSCKYNFVTGSDSHSLNWIGNTFLEFESSENTFEAFRNYIKKSKFC